MISEQRLVWVHLHIPKNAGTTFTDILDRSYGDGHYRIYDLYNPEHKVYRGSYEPDEFRRIVENAPASTRVISGHHIPILSEEESARLNLRYVTWIRHPIDRVLSLYHYERKWAPQKPEVYGENHLSAKPFPIYVEERLKLDDHLSEWQCRDLSGSASFETARSALDRCSVFGIVDRFDDSLLLMRHVMGKQLKCWFEQKNRAQAPTLTPETIPDEIREKLESINQNDLKLYHYARESFERQFDALPNRYVLSRVMHLQNKLYASYKKLRRLLRR